uniref:Probable L-tyrosine/L-aspartate decarboxylase n=1 Tax=Candidatus Methanophagaceae archaeon ANME-1 ERB6 TaxID=2759912 RepID=A0A7G9YYJ7_9EURY|nr:L-tyrosine/L-aspartate decarboxylase [Methanosarcinales archaeon ANME-1 ERB6]
MEERGMEIEAVKKLLQDKKRKDLAYKKILSSMCTYPHEIAVYAHEMFLEANLGDSGLFPGAKEMEEEAVQMIGELLGNENAFGYVSTGGTESNIQAIHAIRNRKRREGLKAMNIIVPETAHFSFDKIGDLLSIEVRKAALDDELRVDVNSVEELIDDKTICMVGIAGTTEFGQIDPIEGLAGIAKAKDIFLHVDAAFGGFVIPFLEQKYAFDFSVEGVSSISIDPHKMGMSTIPAGCILFRDEAYLSELAVLTPYLTTREQCSLIGTRSGASVAATYAVLKYFSNEGLKKIVSECMELTRTLVQGAKAIGISPVIEPVMNVVTLSFPAAEVDRVANALEAKGWRVSVTRVPKALRLVIMPHVKEETVKAFLDDLEGVR